MNKLLVLALGASAASLSFAQGVGPTPYLQTSDSPWVGGSFIYFHLEDMEDGVLDVPGVTNSVGNIINPGSSTDSVDGDDGTVDGSGNNGRSLFSANGNAGISFTFDENELGVLPTHAGIVWTDGAGTISFEAFDANGDSLGTLTGSHATGGFSGQTDEDRFYGWVDNGGISRINIRNSGGGIEVDHLQYGAVPEPATMTLLGLGALAALRRKKNK